MVHQSSLQCVGLRGISTCDGYKRRIVRKIIKVITNNRIILLSSYAVADRLGFPLYQHLLRSLGKCPYAYRSGAIVKGMHQHPASMHLACGSRQLERTSYYFDRTAFYYIQSKREGAGACDSNSGVSTGGMYTTSLSEGLRIPCLTEGANFQVSVH